MTWTVVVAFLFTGQIGLHSFIRSCHSQACVDETLRLAQIDPAVVRVRVFKGGDYDPIGASGANILAPISDEWKQ